jgi:hypothetical protein
MVYVRIVNVTTAVVRDRWRGLHQMQQHQQQPVCMHHDVLQCVFTILAQITSVVDQEMCRQSVVRDMKKSINGGSIHYLVWRHFTGNLSNFSCKAVWQQ